MQRYEGTKRLRARPMTREEYKTYRGWKTPSNENPTDAGYLVEYEDGGKPNDARHAGYISWSPADVFAAAYRPIAEDNPALQPHQQRVVREKADLDDKLGRLQSFVGTVGGAFDSLDSAEQNRLRRQLDLMGLLSNVLAERIAAF